MVKPTTTLAATLAWVLFAGCSSRDSDKAPDPAPESPRTDSRSTERPRTESRPVEDAPLVIVHDATIPDQLATPAPDDIKLLINERTGMPLRDFGRITEMCTGRTIADPPEDLRSHRILVYGAQRIRKQDMFAFYQALLFRDGLVCVPSRRGTGFEVRALEERSWRLTPARRVRWVSPVALAEHQKETEVKILTAVPMKHTKPMDAARRLRPSLPVSLEIGVASENMLILLQGSGAEVHKARELLRGIDVER
jgi:hypothetical protein